MQNDSIVVIFIIKGRTVFIFIYYIVITFSIYFFYIYNTQLKLKYIITSLYNCLYNSSLYKNNHIIYI